MSDTVPSALIVMIETSEAVENAAEIAAVEGVDAVFVGPNDLSHAMGFDNDWMCATVQAGIERALRTICQAGNCAGIIALTPDDEDRFGAWGARYFASVTTGLITQALQRDSAAGGRLDMAGKLTY